MCKTHQVKLTLSKRATINTVQIESSGIQTLLQSHIYSMYECLDVVCRSQPRTLDLTALIAQTNHIQTFTFLGHWRSEQRTWSFCLTGQCGIKWTHVWESLGFQRIKCLWVDEIGLRLCGLAVLHKRTKKINCQPWRQLINWMIKLKT